MRPGCVRVAWGHGGHLPGSSRRCTRGGDVRTHGARTDGPAGVTGWNWRNGPGHQGGSYLEGAGTNGSRGPRSANIQPGHGMIGSMQAEGASQAAFREGSTAVFRDVLDGRVWTASPYRVILDTGTQLVLATWPGAEMLKPATWIESLGTGDDTVRKQAIPNLAAGRWELGRWTWQRTTLLRWGTPGDYFSVS